MSIRNHTRFHLAHYLFLIVLLSFGLLFYFLSVGNAPRQYLAVLFTSALYFLWGVIHHYYEGDLHPRIVVEYLLISLVAALLFRGMLLR